MVSSSISSLCAWLILLMAHPLPCNVPVFRYALERWPSDDYQLVVYHRGPLSRADEKLLGELEQSLAVKISPQNGATSKSCNLQIYRIDVDSTDEAKDVEPSLLRERWKTTLSDKPLKSPFVELRTGSIAGKRVTVWHGSLEKLDVQNLFQSPTRKRIGDRLLKGDAVVWLVLKSNDASKNEPVLKMLREKNKSLSQEVELPDGIGLPGSELYSDVPLLLNFNVVELDRSDKQESILTDLVKALDPEAYEKGEPILVPIFGRGRALEVIPASRVDEGLIGDLTAFLCGACSCQVKERNPGFDLLMVADWQQQLFGDRPLPPPPDTGLGSQSAGPKLRPIPSGKSSR